MKRVQLIKIGGSLIRTKQHLAAIHAALERCAAQRITPLFLMGGGELADAVRKLCAAQGASVEAEHVMCLMAMDQNALLVKSQVPNLQACASTEQAWERILANTPGIYSNFANTLSSQSVESSASITSDSIALWLAMQLAEYARHAQVAMQIEVLILKSCEVSVAVSCDAAMLSSQEIVDAAFPRFAEQFASYANASWQVINVVDYLKSLT